MQPIVMTKQLTLLFGSLMPLLIQAATFDIPNGDIAAFNNALIAANNNGETDTLNLASNGNYTFTALNNSDDGASASVVIRDEGLAVELMINGNGATLSRANNAPAMRLITAAPDVGLTLNNLTVQQGISEAEGGALSVRERGTVELNQVNFRDNVANANGAEDGGGAIFIKNGSLVINGGEFSNNRAGNGGALKNLLTDLTINGAVFTANQSTLADNGTSGGGAIIIDGANDALNNRIVISNSLIVENSGRYQGGALMVFLYQNGAAQLTGLTVRNNNAQQGQSSGQLWGTGGGMWLGGEGNRYRYTLENSAIYSNVAAKAGGGVYLQGNGQFDFTNITLSDNQADTTGSGLGGGIFAGSTNGTLNNVTVADNVAGLEGGGVFGGGRQFTVSNSMFVNNRANNQFDNKHNCSDGSGFNANPAPTFRNGGNNLQFPVIENNFNDPDCTADILQADPLLQPIADNGGGTATRALGAGSPAIDAGNASRCAATDQRGVNRQGASCDIGAFEFGGTPSNGGNSGNNEDSGNPVNLPVLANVLGIAPNGTMANSSAQFFGGIQVGSANNFNNTVNAALTDVLQMDVLIRADAQHVGQTASLIVAGIYQPPVDIGQLFFQVNSDGTLRAWKGQLGSLQPFTAPTNLPAEIRLTLFQGQLPLTGTVSLYIGYRLADGTLIFSATPLLVQLQL